MEDEDEAPDFPALVDRELRIAYVTERAEELWREILSHYQDEARRMRWTR